MARPLINSLILKTSGKIYVQGKSSAQRPEGEVGMRAGGGGAYVGTRPIFGYR